MAQLFDVRCFIDPFQNGTMLVGCHLLQFFYPFFLGSVLQRYSSAQIGNHFRQIILTSLARKSTMLRTRSSGCLPCNEAMPRAGLTFYRKPSWQVQKCTQNLIQMQELVSNIYFIIFLMPTPHFLRKFLQFDSIWPYLTKIFLLCWMFWKPTIDINIIKSIG